MMNYWSKKSIKSTVVVPRSHKNVRGESDGNKPNWVKWGFEKHLAADAQIINYTLKPNPNPKGAPAVHIDNSILCVAVFWDSLTVHGNGSTKTTYPKEGYLSKGEIVPRHFTLNELDDALKFLDAEGYMVMDFNIKQETWEQQVNLFREYMQEVNINTIDMEYSTHPRLEKIKTQHLPSFKEKGLAQYYGSAHSKFMDGARNMQCLQRVYREIFKFPTGYKSIQSCVIFRSAMARLGAMVSYIPNWMVTKEMKDMLTDGRVHGHSFTHDNDHVNKVAVPKGIRPSPDPTKKAICAKSQKDRMSYMRRFTDLISMGWGIPSFDCVSASVKGSKNTNWLHQDLDQNTLIMRIRMLNKHQRMSLTSEPKAKRKKISHDNNGNIPGTSEAIAKIYGDDSDDSDDMRKVAAKPEFEFGDPVQWFCGVQHHGVVVFVQEEEGEYEYIVYHPYLFTTSLGSEILDHDQNCYHALKVSMDVDLKKETCSEYLQHPIDPPPEETMKMLFGSGDSEEEKEVFTEKDSYDLIQPNERLQSAPRGYHRVFPGDPDELFGHWKPVDPSKLKIFVDHSHLSKEVKYYQRYTSYWGWSAYVDKENKLSWVKISTNDEESEMWCVIDKYDEEFE